MHWLFGLCYKCSVIISLSTLFGRVMVVVCGPDEQVFKALWTFEHIITKSKWNLAHLSDSIELQTKQNLCKKKEKKRNQLQWKVYCSEFIVNRRPHGSIIFEMITLAQTNTWKMEHICRFQSVFFLTLYLFSSLFLVSIVGTRKEIEL